MIVRSLWIVSVQFYNPTYISDAENYSKRKIFNFIEKK